MKRRLFLFAFLFCIVLGGVCSCSQEDAASSSAPAQSAARPDLNDPEQRARLIENLFQCLRIWESNDVIEIDENGKSLTPTPAESLEKWRQAKGLTKEDMTDIFARIIREHLAEQETSPDPGKTLEMYNRYIRAHRYLASYPPPREEFMALMRKTVDLDPDHAEAIFRSYIRTNPDWLFGDGTFEIIAERVHLNTEDIQTLLIDMCEQIDRETDEVRKKKLLDKVFESSFQDDNLDIFRYLDRTLLDHYDRSYASMPERKVQLEKAFAREEEKLLENRQKTNERYRRAKYALEHFGEGERVLKTLRELDTNRRRYSAEWAERRMRDDLLLRLQEVVEEHPGLAVCAGAALVLLLAASAFLLIRRAKKAVNRKPMQGGEKTVKERIFPVL
jgi:nicotinic acid mononucleotide adenylyltransferase